MTVFEERRVETNKPVYLVIALFGAISVIGAVLAGYVLFRQLGTEHDARIANNNARIAACQSSNNSRYGGNDYQRPVNRAIVNAIGKEKIIALIIAEGYSPGKAAQMAQVDDLPQINCETGKPVPIPAAPSP